MKKSDDLIKIVKLLAEIDSKHNFNLDKITDYLDTIDYNNIIKSLKEDATKPPCNDYFNITNMQFKTYAAAVKHAKDTVILSRTGYVDFVRYFKEKPMCCVGWDGISDNCECGKSRMQWHVTAGSNTYGDLLFNVVPEECTPG